MTAPQSALHSPRIGVLALQGDFDAHARALEEAGAISAPVRKPEHLTGLDGLVIPGGESSTLLKLMERDDFLVALRDFAKTQPVFGTCAGCILLARTVLNPSQPSIGVLDIAVERNAYGRQVDSTIGTGEARFPGGPLEMVHIRAPRITRTGENVEVLATYGNAPVLVREGHLLAATFHPELSNDRRVHRLFVEMVAG